MHFKVPFIQEANNHAIRKNHACHGKNIEILIESRKKPTIHQAVYIAIDPTKLLTLS